MDFAVAATFAVLAGYAGAQATGIAPGNRAAAASSFTGWAALFTPFAASGAFGTYMTGKCSDGWKQWDQEKPKRQEEALAIASAAMACPIGASATETDENGAFGWKVSGCGKDFRCGLDGEEIVCSPFDPTPQIGTIDDPPESHRAVSTMVTNTTGCASGSARIRGGNDQWIARICEREFRCVGANDEPQRCEETLASVEATRLKTVINRLSRDTGCRTANIQQLEQSAPVEGPDRIYRLAACGKQYVCTNASSRTECKEAQAPPSSL